MELTFLQKLAISGDDRKEWYRTMAKISRDGLPIFEALEKMSKEFAKTKHPLGPLIQVVLMRLRGAGSARAGVQRRTLGTELMQMVPDDEAMLIQAGEASALHAAGFENAQRLVETKGALKSSVVTAMLKPVGYIAAMIALLMFFAFKLLPGFEKTKPRAAWPHSAQLLGSVADHVVMISIFTVLTLAAIGAALQWIAPRWVGERRDWFDEHVFPFTMIAAINGASFLTSISGYISAGTPFVRAVENIQATANPYVRSQCTRILEASKHGKRAEEALLSLPIIPASYHWIIAVYAMSGDASEAYKTISSEMVYTVQKSIERVFKLFVSNLLLAGIGGMIFWIYSAMFDIAMAGRVGL